MATPKSSNQILTKPRWATAIFFLAIRLIIVATLVLPASAQTENVASEVERLLTLYQLREAKVGIIVVDLTTGETIYKRSENELLIPASNAKLLVTAAALHYLGTDFYFVTRLYRTGVVRPDGTLKGDIIVKGSGDPNISDRFFDGNVYAVFEKWAEQLTALGIKTVAGDIVLDDTIFDREFVHPSWDRDDLTNWYAAPVSALSFNDNCVDITVSPSAVLGAPARVSVSPRTAYVTIQNKTKTVAQKAAHFLAFCRKPNTNIIRVRGNIWNNARAYVEPVAVHNPTMYFGTVLRETLKRKGIECRGRVRMAETTVDLASIRAIEIATHKSALSKTIAIANKRSQNFYTEQLLKYLGWKTAGKGTFKNGASAVARFLKQRGHSKGSFIVSDGSGLSRCNRASASLLVDLLEWGLEEKTRRAVFVNSLAISGVDGTLARRMTDDRRKGRILGKTGFLAGVRSLSGYVLGKDGEPTLAFSVLVNYRGSDARPRPFLDAFCLLLISYVDNKVAASEPSPGERVERSILLSIKQ